MVKQKAVTGGVNVIACTVRGCKGSAFIPLTLERVAEVRAGRPKVVKAQATCGHIVEVRFYEPKRRGYRGLS